MNVNLLKLGDPDFPKILTQISGPPGQIYYAGNHPKNWLDMPRVAVVGSRKLTAYGKEVTSRFAAQLAESGVVIVSGLAYGIDITAHQAALSAGGITVAILPSSLDNVYPAAHANIARQIIMRGTLITEYRSGTPTYPANFIARNRLVSGLADILLITEAALKSGSLHTARFALDQGKTVMVVPGNITSPLSEGCNNLIKSGAIPVTSVDDIFFALGLKQASAKQNKPFSGSQKERRVYELIRDGVANQEELALAAKIDSQSLSSALTALEISGYVRPSGGGNWQAA